jgi:glucose-1-phosphate cytidylyltransferase
MAPIGGRPMLWHIMKGFCHWGFRDFVLCLGYRSEAFKHYFMHLRAMTGDVTVDTVSHSSIAYHSPEDLDARVTLVETGRDAMTAGRLAIAARFIPEDDDLFALTYGDGVSDVDFRAVVDFHLSHGRAATVTAVHPPGRFGELSIGRDAEVLRFDEKGTERAHWINGGFFVFSREALPVLAADENVMIEGGPLQELARHGELMAYRHDGFWQCLDTTREYEQLNDAWARRDAPWAVWERQASECSGR